MGAKTVRRTEIDAYGKINFSLDILGRDERRYHYLESVMQTIPVCDSVIITSRPRGGVPPKNVSVPERIPLTLTCDARQIPTDSRNTAYKAAEMMIRRYPVILGTDEEIAVSIKKRIPVGAGLGGSSADCAAVIRGFNIHFGLGLSDDEMIDAGSRLGSDVPFMVCGGTALVSGTGEKIKKLPAPESRFVLVCYPGFGMDTWEVYRKYDEIEKNIDPSSRPDNESLVRALENGDGAAFYAGLRNVLEEPAFALSRKLAELGRRLGGFGCEKVLMSGSGSSFFCIFRRESQARNVMQELETDGNQCMVFAL